MKGYKLSKYIGLCIALVLMMSLVVLPESVLGAETSYEVDLGSLNGESGSVTVRDGYPEALYPEGAYVLQFAGGCGYIYLGHMDLSQYSEVVLNVGSSASAVFSDESGKAYLALTSNGPVAEGNKNTGITPVDTVNILSKKNLSSPPGRWASGEQIVSIPIDSTYVGDVYLAYGPIIRDNNGAPVLDSIVVSKIVFNMADQVEKPPVEKWQDLSDMEIISIVDFEDADIDSDGTQLSEFNRCWKVDRGQYFYICENDDGTKVGKVDDTNYFQAQSFDVMESQAYVFSFDAQIGSAQFYFFVRGTEPVVRANPAWKEAVIGWYEKDWYEENGGATSGAVSTIGASGIALTKGNSDSTLALVVKTYEADGINIASRVINVPVNADIANGINSYKIYDNGEGCIKYYLNDDLFAVVEYNELTLYDDEYDETEYSFYKQVVVKDAYGEILGTVENTRLSQEGVIAFSLRKSSGTTNLIDNLNISMAPYVIVTPEATPENTLEASPVTTPEVTPNATPESTKEATKAPDNSKDTESNILVPICIVAAAVVVIIIAMILIRKRKVENK